MAWRMYLDDTKGVTGVRYAEIEPWAWARLLQTLRAVRKRNEKLVAA